MKLNTNYKKKPKKTEKKKQQEQIKKSKGPKINKNYNDISPLKPDKTVVTLSKLRYGLINSCNLQSVTIQEGTIDLKESWLEFILILLHTVYEQYKQNFINILLEYEVTNTRFMVDKVYGRYVLEEKEQYEVYKLYDTEYYIEAIFDYKTIFWSIINLVRCLDIQSNEISFNLVSKDFKEVRLNFDQLKNEETVVDIDNVASMLKSGIHMISISILGSSIEVHRLDVALVAFCNWTYDNYGYETTKSLKKYNNTGISIENSDDKQYVKIRTSSLCVYTDNKVDDIIKFIQQSLDNLKIPRKQFKFKFRALKKVEELKEWEID